MSTEMMTGEQARRITRILSKTPLSKKRYGRLLRSNGIDPDGDLSSKTITSGRADSLIQSLKEVQLELKGRKITARQIKTVHALTHALGIEDTAYRQGLRDLFCVETSKALTERQARHLIEILEIDGISEGVWEKKSYTTRYDELGTRANMAVPAQLRKIEAIWHSLYPDNDKNLEMKSLRHFLFRFFNVSDLRFLDSEAANKVLYALRKMTQRKIVIPENGQEIVFGDKAV